MNFSGVEINLMLATREWQNIVEKSFTPLFREYCMYISTLFQNKLAPRDIRQQAKVHLEIPSWGNREFNLRMRTQ